MGKTWFQTGMDGRARSQQEDEMKALKRKSGSPFRFRLNANESAKVVFIDTPNFFFYEHSMYNIAKGMDPVTCIKDAEHCPLCDLENPAYCLAATIIDTRTSTSKDGTKEYKNQKRLVIFKGKARQTILRRAESQDFKLEGAVFEFARGSSTTECATGEDIQFLKKISLESVKKLCPPDQDAEEYIKPFEYPEILKPLPANQLRRLVGLPAPVGSADVDDLGDDDIGGDDSGAVGDAIDEIGETSIDDLV